MKKITLLITALLIVLTGCTQSKDHEAERISLLKLAKTYCEDKGGILDFEVTMFYTRPDMGIVSCEKFPYNKLSKMFSSDEYMCYKQGCYK